MYWAFQTITTVGYGDFGCNNLSEYIITIIWMFIGVAFYSFVLGSLTSIVSSEMSNADTLNNKLKQLEDYSKETGMEDDLFMKLRQFLLNNYNELFSKQDEEALLLDLPNSLKEDVLYSEFGGLVESIKILRESEDNEFVWAIV